MLERSGGTAGALRVLIVDDDETARDALVGFASRDGVEIIEADNGTHGIELALHESPTSSSST